MKIDTISLKNPFILAPLAGYTNLPFRLLCREFGAALCYSEMVSSHGLVYGGSKTKHLCRTVDTERPVAIQLFGHDPEIMGEAAAILAELDIDIIDINMGCPARKVVKKGGGAALMQNPKQAAAILEEVCAKSSKPVTVKIRSGVDKSHITAVDFARMAEGCGVKAVAVHGRTWSQAFSGLADWDIIGLVKKAVTIPVIGNGDITTYNDGLDMIASTGCDGVMIGRAALGNPWVFQPEGRPSSIPGRLTALKRHLELIATYLPNKGHLPAVKNIAGRYLKGVPGGSAMRQKIYNVPSFEELLELASPS